MEEKNNIKDFENFQNNYIEKECESKTLIFTVLTGFNRLSASRPMGEKYPSANIKCLAFINENNDVMEGDIKFKYYLNNESPLKFIRTENLCTYSIKCKKIKDKDLYYLLEAVKVCDKRFDNIIQEYLKPIIIKIDDTSFTFDKRFSHFEGNAVVKNKKIDILLKSDKNSVNADKSIETFKKIKADFINFYEDVLRKCSKEIVGPANEWKSDNTYHTITENEIIKILDNDNISMTINANNFAIYFRDNELFLGHTIVYYGNIDNLKFSVDIVG